MLDLAVKARLPLVHVETEDTVNIAAVLQEIVGFSVPVGKVRSTGFKDIKYEGVYWSEGNIDTNWNLVYTGYNLKSATLIVIGGPPHPAFFEAGYVVAPHKMINQLVHKYATASEAPLIATALAGLTLKQVQEISRMAMTDKGEYSAKSVQDLRRRYFGAIRGLELVRTDALTYQPPPPLLEWLEMDAQFVSSHVSATIRPRGLLLTGASGTGKTMGAKYIAEELKLPLYRLSIGIVMSKWAGESEKNLHAALRQAENCAPCIILLDEVEKLFVGVEEGGVNTRLLASLLWWLQEHQQAVFTVMTTNQPDLIPPELIRPGRIDKRLHLDLLISSASSKFASYLMKEFDLIHVLNMEQRAKVFATLEDGYADHSHAHVVGVVVTAIKQALLDKPNKKG